VEAAHQQVGRVVQSRNGWVGLRLRYVLLIFNLVNLKWQFFCEWWESCQVTTRSSDVCVSQTVPCHNHGNEMEPTTRTKLHPGSS